MSSYPSSAKTFISRSAGQTIQPAHINDLQDEVNAVESALLGTLAHDITINGTFSVTKFGGHSFIAAGTGQHFLVLQNTSAGTGNKTELFIGNDSSSSLLQLVTYSSTYTAAAGFDAANGSVIYQGGAGGLSLVAGNAAGTIRLYASGERVRLFASGGLYVGDTPVDPAANNLIVQGITNSGSFFSATSGYSMTTWPTTASAANANVADGTVVKRSTSIRAHKRDIAPISGAAARQAVLGLEPVTYRSAIPTDTDRIWPGFIADDAEQVEPALVMYDPNGALEGFAYDRVPAYIVRYLHDVERRLSALEMK